MKIYVTLEKRPRDKEEWPALWLNQRNAFLSDHRVSDVAEIDLELNPQIEAERHDARLLEAG